MVLEDRVGPFTMIALIAAAIAIAALGHSRPRPAGALLLTSGFAPFLLAIVGRVQLGPPPVLYAIIGAPMVLAGILFVMSDRTAHRAPPSAEPQTFGEKKAA